MVPLPRIRSRMFPTSVAKIAEVGNTRVRWEGREIVPAARFLSALRIFRSWLLDFSVSIEELWLLPFAPWNREKGSGTPVDADPYPPHPAVRLCCLASRSPAGVPLAALAKGTFVPKAQRQAMFPATWPERLILDRPTGRGAHAAPRALPAPRLSQSSESTSRAGHSAGRHHAQAARERAVSSRPRAPHSLRFREYPRPKASFTERIRIAL